MADMPDSPQLSDDPADLLVRELIASRRPATSGEVAAIVERMATAPFDTQIVRVRHDERGVRYRGRVLGSRESSLAYHLIKRVVVEQQWADGTTAEGYLADLRRAVGDPLAHLLVYERRGGVVAATITPTERVVLAASRGLRALPNLLVLYAADRGMIVSGYQFSGRETLAIPQEARWLK